MIIDTHAHLDHLENLDQAMANAKEANVDAIVAMSMDLASCHKNLEIKRARNDVNIFLCMGMHPSETNLDDLDACCDLIRQNAGELTAIGEIGLDFWYKWVRKDKEKKDAQRTAYRRFLELAKELSLPAVIHSRGCWRECFETAKEIGVKKCEFHWYSGPIDVLDDIMAEGYYVSGGPSLAYSEQLRAAISHAPSAQVLLETDCPVTYRNRDTGEEFIAEPKDVWRSLKAYCELKGLSKEDALSIIRSNACTFFGIKL